MIYGVALYCLYLKISKFNLKHFINARIILNNVDIMTMWVNARIRMSCQKITSFYCNAAHKIQESTTILPYHN